MNVLVTIPSKDALKHYRNGTFWTTYSFLVDIQFSAINLSFWINIQLITKSQDNFKPKLAIKTIYVWLVITSFLFQSYEMTFIILTFVYFATLLLYYCAKLYHMNGSSINNFIRSIWWLCDLKYKIYSEFEKLSLTKKRLRRQP